jgi:hypothetical protein
MSGDNHPESTLSTWVIIGVGAMALLAGLIAGRSVYEATEVSGTLALLIGFAAAMIVAALAGTVFLLLGTIAAAKKRKEEFAGLEAVVLVLGLCAGIGVGIFVGVDSWQRLREETRKSSVQVEVNGQIPEQKTANEGKAQPLHKPTLDSNYLLITQVLGPGVVSGLILAILVAVGSIVFIFERNIANFMREAQKLTNEATLGSRELQRHGPPIAYSLVALQNLANSLIGVKEELVRSGETFTLAKANYLSAWVSRVRAAGQRGTEQEGLIREAAIRAIAGAYWNEESTDVCRLELVTNSRNYTAFLTGAVEAVRDEIRKANLEDRLAVHFYTVTPASVGCLLNWPQHRQEMTSGLPHAHYESHFISSYMLQIAELVSDHTFVHRRWIWKKGNESREKLPPLFAKWDHYEGERYPTPEDDDLRVLGVPLPACKIQKFGSAHLRRSLYCERASLEEFGDWFKAYEKERQEQKRSPGLVAEEIYAMPLFAGHPSDWRQVVEQERESVFSMLEGLLSPILEQIREIREAAGQRGAHPSPLLSLRREFMEWLAAPRGDIRIAMLLLSLQLLDAGFSIHGVSQEDLERLKVAETALVRFMWHKHWDKWLAAQVTQDLPRLQDYFSAAFHSDNGPHLVPWDYALGDVNFKETGPEFAILGIEHLAPNGGPVTTDGEMHDSEGPVVTYTDPDRGQQKRIVPLLGFRSTISDPWEWGKMQIVLPGPKSMMNHLVSAMNKLFEHTIRHASDKLRVRGQVGKTKV